MQKKSKKIITLLKLALPIQILQIMLLVQSTCAQAEMLRFAKVADGIYRGSQPKNVDLKKLAKLGVKIILNLRDTGPTAEDQMAQQLEMHVVHAPINSLSSFLGEEPDSRSINAAAILLKNASNLPVFVHCKEGKDRTSLVIGLFRVQEQKWAAAKAYEEMLSFDFDPQMMGGLNLYFQKVTGYPEKAPIEMF